MLDIVPFSTIQYHVRKHVTFFTTEAGISYQLLGLDVGFSVGLTCSSSLIT